MRQLCPIQSTFDFVGSTSGIFFSEYAAVEQCLATIPKYAELGHTIDFVGSSYSMTDINGLAKTTETQSSCPNDDMNYAFSTKNSDRMLDLHLCSNAKCEHCGSYSADTLSEIFSSMHHETSSVETLPNCKPSAACDYLQNSTMSRSGVECNIAAYNSLLSEAYRGVLNLREYLNGHREKHYLETAEDEFILLPDQPRLSTSSDATLLRDFEDYSSSLSLVYSDSSSSCLEFSNDNVEYFVEAMKSLDEASNYQLIVTTKEEDCSSRIPNEKMEYSEEPCSHLTAEKTQKKLTSFSLEQAHKDRFNIKTFNCYVNFDEFPADYVPAPSSCDTSTPFIQSQASNMLFEKIPSLNMCPETKNGIAKTKTIENLKQSQKIVKKCSTTRRNCQKSPSVSSVSTTDQSDVATATESDTIDFSPDLCYAGVDHSILPKQFSKTFLKVNFVTGEKSEGKNFKNLYFERKKNFNSKGNERKDLEIGSSKINEKSKPGIRKRTGVYDVQLNEYGLVATFAARKGVYYDKARKLWRANWKENGKIQTKGFSVNEFGCHVAARQKAIDFREQKERTLEFYRVQKLSREVKNISKHTVINKALRPYSTPHQVVT